MTLLFYLENLDIGARIFSFDKKAGIVILDQIYFFLLMKSFQDLARKNFSEKFQGNRMLGTLALKVVKQYFHIEKKAENVVTDEVIEGFLRYQTLFLKTADQALKIQIFKEKEKLIAAINQHFQALGYRQEVREIRLKV